VGTNGSSVVGYLFTNTIYPKFMPDSRARNSYGIGSVSHLRGKAKEAIVPSGRFIFIIYIY